MTGCPEDGRPRAADGAAASYSKTQSKDKKRY